MPTFRHIAPALFATLFLGAFASAQIPATDTAAPIGQNADTDKKEADDPAVPEKAKITELQHTLEEMLELKGVPKILYKDEYGTLLGADEFYKRVYDGSSFNTTKEMIDKQVSSAVLTLQTEAQAKAATTNNYKINPGDAFPKFQKKDLNGHNLSNKQLLGRYSLVNFYFSQCGPCVKEIPVLNALADRHADMNFVAITFDSTAEARAFAGDKKFNWKILAEDNSFIAKLGVKAYPAFMLLDPHGIVVGMATGSEVGNKDGSVESWMNRLMAAKGS